MTLCLLKIFTLFSFCRIVKDSDDKVEVKVEHDANSSGQLSPQKQKKAKERSTTQVYFIRLPIHFCFNSLKYMCFMLREAELSCEIKWNILFCLCVYKCVFVF